MLENGHDGRPSRPVLSPSCSNMTGKRRTMRSIAAIGTLLALLSCEISLAASFQRHDQPSSSSSSSSHFPRIGGGVSQRARLHSSISAETASDRLPERRRGNADAGGSMLRRQQRHRFNRREASTAPAASASASASAPAPAPAPASTRTLAPPFPNGLCGGTLVTLPPEQTYGYTEDDNALIAAASSGSANSIFLPPRPIDVWLPPTYDLSGSSRHPVLYVHDGQNAIDDDSSWTGSSWRMAGALTRLAERNLLDSSHLGSKVDPLPILVLLPSADGDMLPGVRRRHLEYGDPSVPVAQAHADFVAEKVLPVINSRFRTVRDNPAANSAIGTSMGGQASLHLLLRHPDLFGGAAALSPAFQPATIAMTAASADALKDKSIYLDNGGDDDTTDTKVPWFSLMDHVTPKHWWNPGYFWLDTQLQPGIDAMKTALDVMGVRYEYNKVLGGRHNERAWAQRIDAPLVHLLGRRKK